MNYRTIVHQSALLGLLVSGIMLVMALLFWAASGLAGRTVDLAALAAMLATGGVGLAAGVAAWRLSRGPTYLGRKEAMLLVAMSWIFGSALAAMPYWIWARFAGGDAPADQFRSFVDCYFEAVSGLTTAGSSILADVEHIPRILLLWRATTHWLGGIGIVVLFVAVFPAVGVGAKRLFMFEASGVVKEGVLPTIRSTARILLLIYVGLTVAEVLALVLAGMSWFDAVCHAFASLATGGFSTRNASVGAYDSLPIDGIVTLFMVLGGVNFALYYQLFRGNVREAWTNRELRLYLALLAGGALLVALMVTGRTISTSDGRSVDAQFGQALRYALFNVASVQTTTGFCTADYNQWPDAARAVMFGLILLGGCAGSTAGGIKIVRAIVVAKVILNMVEHAFRPQVIRPIRVGRVAIERDVELATVVFVLTTLVVLAAGSFALLLLEPAGTIDVTTAVSANLATFCTTGPGFNKVGPVANFAWLSPGSKIVLCAVMLLGRLELMALLAVFAPAFWRRD